jgi:hypothetical protein
MVSPELAKTLIGIDIVNNQRQADAYEVTPEKPVVKITANGKTIELPVLILPGLKLYPNPFTSIFTIDWEANNEKVQIDVLNMDGKVVISDVFFGNSNANIDLTTFPDGVYNVSIQTSKGSIHRRIVKLN